MTIHLKPEEIEAVIAGLEIEDEARKHFESCVLCRTEAAEFKELIEVRRAEMATREPDWTLQAEEIMGRIPVRAATVIRPRSGWMRPILALAAVMVIAVGIGILRMDAPPETPVDDLAVEEILAEMDELLSNDSIPGFEIIDPWSDDHAMDFGYAEPTPIESVG